MRCAAGSSRLGVAGLSGVVLPAAGRATVFIILSIIGLTVRSGLRPGAGIISLIGIVSRLGIGLAMRLTGRGGRSGSENIKGGLTGDTRFMLSL